MIRPFTAFFNSICIASALSPQPLPLLTLACSSLAAYYLSERCHSPLPPSSFPHLLNCLPTATIPWLICGWVVASMREYSRQVLAP